MKNIIKLSAILAMFSTITLQAGCPAGLVRGPRGCQSPQPTQPTSCPAGYLLATRTSCVPLDR